MSRKYNSFEDYERDHRRWEMDPCPCPQHMVEVQHGKITLLKSRAEVAKKLGKGYRVMDDTRLVKVTLSRYRHRLGLIVHTFAHKGLPGVLKVKFIDRPSITSPTVAILDECEVQRLNREEA